MGKFEELNVRARELFESGKTQKEIAQMLDVSEVTIVEWKKKFEGTPYDWDDRRQKAMQQKRSVASWLEDQIHITMEASDKAEGEEKTDLLIRLDRYISMKKKYDGSIDKLGETSRVMGAFASFVRENFPDDVETVKEITNAFMRYMAR